MCVSSRTIYECKDENDKHHSMRHAKACDTCSTGPLFDINDSGNNVYVQGQGKTREPLMTDSSDSAERDIAAAAITTGPNDKTADLEPQDQCTIMTPKLVLRGALLVPLRQAGFRQSGLPSESEGAANASVDRSPCCFAAAREHLERRMGK